MIYAADCIDSYSLSGNGKGMDKGALTSTFVYPFPAEGMAREHVPHSPPSIGGNGQPPTAEQAAR